MDDVPISMDGKRIQDVVREACSLSYVSGKLGISRPTLYKYMEMYDSGQSARMPAPARNFFDYMSSGRRTEDDVMLFFIRGADRKVREPDEDALTDDASVGSPVIPTKTSCVPPDGDAAAPGRSVDVVREAGTVRTACVTDGSNATIVFSDAFGKVDSTIVEVYTEIDGEEFLLGEFSPAPGMRYVKAELPPGCGGSYIVRQRSGGLSVTSGKLQIGSR